MSILLGPITPNIRSSRARGTPGPVLPAPFKLAGAGMRLPTTPTVITENNFGAVDKAIGMPDVEVSRAYFFFPTAYWTTTGEVDCGNGYTIEGIATKGHNGFRTRGNIDGGLASVVIDPVQSTMIYGKWVLFEPDTPIPAGSTQMFSFAYEMPNGTVPRGRNLQTNGDEFVNMFGDIMPAESFQRGSSSFLSTLSDDTAYNNQNGPPPPVPCLMLVEGLDRSALILGDSIDYGSAATSPRYFEANMAFGHIELALQENFETRRIPGNNIAIPGWGCHADDAGDTHGNANSSLRQLWAFEQARALNSGQPIADEIWCGHGQNSIGRGIDGMLEGARSTAAIWRAAIGNVNAPIRWIGMPANTDSTDGWQTTANQTPRNGAEFPDEARFQFNAALEEGGALRADGTVDTGIQIYTVSSEPDPDRDILQALPFSTTIATAHPAGGGTTKFVADAPQVGERLIAVDPSDGSTLGSSSVQEVSGDGPYQITYALNSDPALPVGTILQAIWTDEGVHFSPRAHVQYSQPTIDAKIALGLGRPDFAPSFTSSEITGVPQDGQTLTAVYEGTGKPIPNATYQWQRNGNDIAGETGATIALDAAGDGWQVDDVVSCEITLTNTEGSVTAEPSRTFEASADIRLVKPANAWFRDPNGVGTGVSRLTFGGKFEFAGPVSSALRLYAQLSTGCDLFANPDGSMRSTIEDGTGAKMLLNATVAPAGTIIWGTEQEIEFDVNMPDEQAVVTVDGVPTITPFTGSGNGLFQNIRAVSFLATGTGVTQLPAGTIFRDLFVNKNGVLHKAIPNVAAAANGDDWKPGGTDDFANL